MDGKAAWSQFDALLKEAGISVEAIIDMSVCQIKIDK